MRIILWNIRAGGGKRVAGILQQLQAWNPDVIGLSEFRGTPPSQTLAHNLAASGYPHQLMTITPEKWATNALLLASRFPLQQLQRATQPHQPTVVQRWLFATVKSEIPITIGLMHIPNFTSPDKQPYLDTVLKMLKSWQLGPALIGGDTNCGKMFVDEEGANPSLFKKEHAWVAGVEACGWPDAFRHLHADKREFTWYSHRNNGFRLDHAYLNPQLLPALQHTSHRWGQTPEQSDRRAILSDHAALVLDLDLTKLSVASQ